VTLHLDHSTAFSGQGYQGVGHADLTVLLRRTRVVERTVKEPVPANLP
jgi:hypothetical protein